MAEPRSRRPSSPTSSSARPTPAQRWERLADRGARVQRPLWASTSTKNPAYPDTLYVDSLIGPDTVNTLPESTLQAFEDHGTLARTIDVDVSRRAARSCAVSPRVGVDMDDVGRTLEREGIAAFQASFDHVLGTLDAMGHAPARVPRRLPTDERASPPVDTSSTTRHA